MALINIDRPFLNIPWSKRAAAYYILLLLNTFLYTLIFDTPRLDLYNLSNKEEALILLLFALFNLFLFFLLMLSKWVFVIINPVLYYIGAKGYIYADKFYLDTNMYTAPRFLLQDTITNSASYHISTTIFITAMFFLGLILGLIRFLFARDKSVIRRGQAFAFIVIISIFSYTYLYNHYNYITMQPFAFLKGVRDYTAGYIYHSFTNSKRENKDSASKTQDNITGVLILVDKLNKDIFNNKDNSLISDYEFIIFNNFKSDFANQYSTRSAVITGASAENMENIMGNRSILSLFKNAGYKVDYVGIYNSLTAKDPFNYKIIKNDMDEIHEENTYAAPNLFSSLTYLENFLNNNKGGLFVVNAEGSSPLIKDRHNCFMDNTNDNITENYKSYLNGFIYETIEYLKKRDAFIIIAGMEGEIINNNTALQPEKATVMNIWVSDSMEKNYGAKTSILNNKNDAVFTDTIYNTLQGCFQMESKTLNNSRNLCRKTAE